jgi:hypothetical protein
LTSPPPESLFSSFFRIFWILTSWNVFSHHFFRIFWTLTSPPPESLFSSFFRIFWTLTSWNVFSHHFFGIFELGFSTSWKSFLIIFSDFLNFDLLKRLFPSFF